MSFLTIVCFLVMGVYVLHLRRQVREISEEVSRMHKDFLGEVYLRYESELDGEE